MRIEIKKLSANAYLTIGMIFSIIVSLLGIQHFYLYQLIFLVMYYISLNTGRKISLGVKKAKSLPKITGAFLFLVVSRLLVCSSLAAAVSNIGLIIVYYLEFITGYVAYTRYKNKERIFDLPMMILLVTVVFGIYTYFLGYSPLKNYFENIVSEVSRISSVYVHPIPCAVLFSVCFWFVIFIVNSTSIKIILTILTLYGIYLTSSRSVWLSVAVTASLLFICKLMHMKTKISERRMLGFFGALCTLVIIFIGMHEQIADVYDGIYTRLFAKNYSEDMSYTWRFMAAGTMINQLSPLSIRTYLGHGYNTAANYMRDMINIGSKFSYNVSTVDNGFVSILYDFGLIGFVLYCIPLVLSLVGIFKDTDRNERCIDCIIFTIMVSSFFFEAVYWDSISFILMTFLGFKMYYIENRGKNRCLTKSHWQEMQYSVH